MRILVAIDGSNSTTGVLRTGASWARPGDEVHVLHVVNPREARPTFTSSDGLREYTERYPVPPPEVVRLPVESSAQATERVHDEYRGMLGALLADVAGGRGWHVHVDIDDDPARAILGAARRLRVEAIVVGTRNRGRLARAILGSVSEAVIDGASVPVILAPHRPTEIEGRPTSTTAATT